MMIRAIAAASVIVMMSSRTFGQSATPLAFEAAAIKLAGAAPAFTLGSPPNPIRIAGNRVTASATLNVLIMATYDVKDYQVSGGPSWAGAELYSITAKTAGDGTPTLDQVRPMFQTLLADRFQLKFHRITKDRPVYEMVMEKNGQQNAPDASPPVDNRGRPIVQRAVTRQSMRALVRWLSLYGDRVVIDKTGLSEDYYDYKLEYARNDRLTDETIRKALSEYPRVGQQLAPIVEQLGLKLEPVNEPTEFLVIDHAEQPNDN